MRLLSGVVSRFWIMKTLIWLHLVLEQALHMLKSHSNLESCQTMNLLRTIISTVIIPLFLKPRNQRANPYICISILLFKMLMMHRHFLIQSTSVLMY